MLPTVYWNTTTASRRMVAGTRTDATESYVYYDESTVWYSTSNTYENEERDNAYILRSEQKYKNKINNRLWRDYGFQKQATFHPGNRKQPYGKSISRTIYHKKLPRSH